MAVRERERKRQRERQRGREREAEEDQFQIANMLCKRRLEKARQCERDK